MNDKPDQSFDSILNKFDNNIYGSSKGTLRHELLLHHLNPYLTRQSLLDPPTTLTRQSLLGANPTALDVGAGTGIMTAELASRGYQVTFNDLSEEAMEKAKARFVDNPKVRFANGGLSKLDSQVQYDLVVCHAVLEWLNSPYAALQSLCDLVKPGGLLSLSFFNLDAHRFGNIIYGNFDYVQQGMPRKNTVRLNPNNALSPRDVIDKLKKMPLTIEHTAGIRCFHDYLKDREKQSTQYGELKSLEIKYSAQEPYKWLGKYFHLILSKNEDE